MAAWAGCGGYVSMKRGLRLAAGGMSSIETNAKHNAVSRNNAVLHCSAWAEISLQKR